VPIWPNQSGTGLLVLSRIPIVDVIYKRCRLVLFCRARCIRLTARMHVSQSNRFDVNGRLYRFDHMGIVISFLRVSSSTRLSVVLSRDRWSGWERLRSRPFEKAGISCATFVAFTRRACGSNVIDPSAC